MSVNTDKAPSTAPGSQNRLIAHELTQAERERGYAECTEILRKHGKTFYFMARLLGPERGRGIAAIYGFARTSDDTVDEAVPGSNPQAELEHMKAELRLACAAKSTDPRFAVLGETINKFGIALYPFDDLIDGVAMDLAKNRYANFDELELYCYRVAGTIGLMITPVAGFVSGSRALEFAKTLGTAFQLTNILRDVGEDLRRGRIYLPQDDLARFGITEADLHAHRNDDRFKAMMRFQIERARALYDEGLQLIPLVTSPAGRLAFQFAVDAYSEILVKIMFNDYNVFTKRAHLTFWEKVWMVPKSWWRARTRVYRSLVHEQR